MSDQTNGQALVMAALDEALACSVSVPSGERGLYCVMPCGYRTPYDRWDEWHRQHHIALAVDAAVAGESE